MIRVVDILPGKAEIAASGLKARDFIVDREIYRHFIEQCRREFIDFKRTFNEKDRTDGGSAHPDRTDGVFTESDETCIEAFNRSRPLFCYHRGSLYRYRIDHAGTEDRPILLERAERSEVSGSIAGIPVSSEHQGLLIRFCAWIERKLQEREQRKKC